jgi:GGDEF domain-containing protein
MRFSEAEILKKADEALYIVKKGNRKGTLMEL